MLTDNDSKVKTRKRGENSDRSSGCLVLSRVSKMIEGHFLMGFKVFISGGSPILIGLPMRSAGILRRK